MKNSLNHQINHINQIESVNRFIYFLSTAPILKRFFHLDLVKEYIPKEGIELAFKSTSYLRIIIKKIIYIILISLLCGNDYNSFGYYFVLLTIIGGAIRNIINFDVDDYTFVMLFNTNSKGYAINRINTYIIKEFLSFAIVFIGFSFITKLNYLTLIYYLIVYISIHLISEHIAFYLIKRNNNILTNNHIHNFLLILTVIIICLTLGISIALPLNIPNYIVMIISFIFILIAAYSYYYLNHKVNYKKIFKYNLKPEVINTIDIKYTQNFNTIQAANEMINKVSNTKVTSSKKGYDYIYDVYLQRFRKTFMNGLYLKSIIIIIIGLILVIAPYFINDYRHALALAIYQRIYFLMFIIYYLSSSSKNFVLSLFLQIDRYLINYHFFRRTQDIAKNYRIRLKTITLITMIPTLLIAIFLTTTYILHANPFNIYQMMVIILLPIILGVFYSIYYLSTYYLFQPFGNDGQIINKAYGIVDYIIYLISYFSIHLDVEFKPIILIMFTIVIAIISITLYLLVLKFAPNRFRVK